MQSGLFIGDTHSGAKFFNGLTATPRHIAQDFLWSCVEDVVARVAKKIAVGYTVNTMFGGDHVDKPGKDFRDIARPALQYVLERTNGNAWGVLGTPYHVGSGGEEDAQLYMDLGIEDANVKAVHRFLEIGKSTIFWAHHGIPIGAEPARDSIVQTQFAARAQDNHMAEYGRVADYYIAHHVHRTPLSVATYDRTWGGKNVRTKAGVVPCFSLPDEYAAKKLPLWTPTIGVLWIDFEHQTEEYWTYAIPESVLYAW